MRSIDLLSNKTLVEAPFVKVDIGEYTFGVFQRKRIGGSSFKINYPNYIKSLSVGKINGTVNQYTLLINYPVTMDSDPNFFEKVFSSVSDTRRIVFSYGDFSAPEYIYGEEEALITDVNSVVDIRTSSINYTVKAVSSAAASMSGTYTFKKRVAKPSSVLLEILYETKYGLTNLFKGMQDKSKVMSAGMIAMDDAIVTLEAQTMSPLNYINYLVANMKPNADRGQGSTNKTVYTMVISEDRERLYGGTYFKVQKLDRNSNSLESSAAYSIDIGYPSADLVTEFKIVNQQGYSILYDYINAIDSYDYGKRIDDNGVLTYVQANPLTSSKQLHLTTEADKTWWTKVTEFPIQVELSIRGLLKPAILMSYVKLNVWFYGRKHISSGYYIITSQTDKIDESGFKTDLSLTRIAPDGDIDIAIGMFGEKITTGINADVVQPNATSNDTILTRDKVKVMAKKATDITEKYSTIKNTKLDKLGDVYIHVGDTPKTTTKISYDENTIIVGNGSLDISKPWVDKVVNGKR